METTKSYTKTIDKKTHIYYYIVKSDEIVKITYKDYINQLNDKRKTENQIIQETQESYEISGGNTKIKHEHDKTYRTLLSNKEDVAYIINQVLKLAEQGKVKPEELEKYKSSFVTSQFENKEADIVYKIKDRNLFFLIEHQNKVDYSISYRIREYREEIIRSAIDEKKVKTKGYKIPEVITIVIYTGKPKWTVSRYIDYIDDERFRKVNLLKYNLVDINQYEEKELLDSEHFIDKMFLIEKTKDRQEFADVLEEIILRTKDEGAKKQLSILIQMILKGKIGEEKGNELIKKLKAFLWIRKNTV